MKKIALVFLLILPLTTCRNPAALLDKLEDDVMSANGLYLEILEVSPDENGQYINPGEDIRIEFDRPIDLSSVEGAYSVIDSDKVEFGTDSAIKDLTYTFDEATNILTIKANPYLDGLKQYTVSIKAGIRGTDGSTLREAMSWSFSTSDAPRGYVEFAGNYYNADDESGGNIVLNIYSQGATYCSVSDNSSSFDWEHVDVQLTGNPTTYVVDFDNADVFNSAASEGTINLYVVFRDGYSGQAGIANLSEVESDSMIYDETPPDISFDSDDYRMSANIPSRQLSIGVSDPLGAGADVGSGIDTTSYLCAAGTASVDSNAATTYPTVTAGSAETSYTVSFTVADRAGNVTTEDLTLVRDNTAPAVPSLINFPASGTNLHTTRSLDYTLVTAGDSDLDRTEYSVVNDTKSASSWTTYVAGKYIPTMLYGSSRVYFRSVDTAGNYSSEVSRLYYGFPSYITGISPSNGSYLTGDIAWAETSKAYITADYYRAYLATSGRGPFTQIGAGGTYRSLAYVDTTELSLILFQTYYWYFEVYGSTYKLLYTSPVYSFRASKF